MGIDRRTPEANIREATYEESHGARQMNQKWDKLEEKVEKGERVTNGDVYELTLYATRYMAGRVNKTIASFESLPSLQQLAVKTQDKLGFETSLKHDKEEFLHLVSLAHAANILANVGKFETPLQVTKDNEYERNILAEASSSLKYAVESQLLNNRHLHDEKFDAVWSQLAKHLTGNSPTDTE